MLPANKEEMLTSSSEQINDLHLKLPSYLFFFLYSIIVSSFFSRIHDLKSDLMLDERDMGILLLSLPGGVIAGSLFAAHAVNRFTPKLVILLGMPVFSILPLLAMKSADVTMAFLILFTYGLFSSLMNISINVESNQLEEKNGILILNKCHGTFSLGFLTFSFIAAILIGLGVTAIEQHWAVCVVVSLIIILIYVHHHIFKTHNPLEERHQHHDSKTLALPSAAILFVLFYGLFGFSMEGILRSWGVIYMESGFHVDMSIAAYALPFLIFGTSAGRFLADNMRAYFGTGNSTNIFLLVALSGVGLCTLSSSYNLSLVGIALIGFGVSTVHPQSIKAVASLKENSPAHNIAAFSTVQTALMYIGPSLYGVLAYHAGFRVALLLFVPLAAISYLFARFIQE